MQIKYKDDEILGATICVPAHFNHRQRVATANAAKLANITVLSILTEPTAAVLCFSSGRNFSKPTNILVYDLGGGTFDVSILSVVNQEFTVRATAGHSNLGGENFDLKIVKHWVKNLEDNECIDSKTITLEEWTCLRNAAKSAKEKLGTNLFATENVIVCDKNRKLKLSKSEFENLISGDIDTTMNLLASALETSKVAKTNIHVILLIGGSSKIGLVKEKLLRFLPECSQALLAGISPVEAVAKGACIRAVNQLAAKLKATKQSKFFMEIPNIRLYDVLPCGIGVAVVQGEDGKLYFQEEGEQQYHEIVPAKSSLPISITVPHDKNNPLRMIQAFRNGNILQEQIKIQVFEENLDNLFGELVLDKLYPAENKGDHAIQLKLGVTECGVVKIVAELIAGLKKHNGTSEKILSKFSKGWLETEKFEEMKQLRDVNQVREKNRIEMEKVASELLNFCKFELESNDKSPATNLEKYFIQIKETLKWHDDDKITKSTNEYLQRFNDLKQLQKDSLINKRELECSIDEVTTTIVGEALSKRQKGSNADHENTEESKEESDK